MRTVPTITKPTTALIIVGFLGCVVLASNTVTLFSVTDDAFISYRYLDNWLDGHGLVYNPGETVEGYSNFLWLVLLAPLRLLGMGPVAASMILSVVSLILLMWAIYRTASKLAGDPAAGVAALVMAATSLPLARWSASGMETICFACLLALASMRLAERRRHDLLSSLFFGLAVLTRPEGIMHAAIAFAAAVILSGPDRVRTIRRLPGPALLFLAFPLGQLIFRMLYYGLPLPNTFYAKLGGDMPNLVPAGLIYLREFLLPGGIVLIASALLALRFRLLRNWVVANLLLLIVCHLAFVVRVGGDYFPFHRFIVPVIPAMAVLAGIGLSKTLFQLVGNEAWRKAVIVTVLAVSQLVTTHASKSGRAFEMVVETRREREQVAGWIVSNVPADARLAVNAAGLIPYRTGMRTIDMLGLNDRHIASSAVAHHAGGNAGLVGHYKHDGAYVCQRAPDVVVTSGGRLHRGRHAAEAIMQSALNSFTGDREFLEACEGRYQPVAEELSPGRFVVVYLRNADRTPGSAETRNPDTAQGWFQRGLTMMGNARLEEAVESFEESLRLNPGHPVAMTNLGFCLFDLGRHQAAIRLFEDVLARDEHQFEALFGLAQAHQASGDRVQAIRLWRRYIAEAPDSLWKERAQEHLYMLNGE